MKASTAQIREKYELALERIHTFHFRTIGDNPGPVFLISTAYPGVWLEHAFDGLCYAKLFAPDPEAVKIAENQMLLFLRNQKSDGHIPYNVLDPTIGNKNYANHSPTGFRQLQECVSLGSLCLETYSLSKNKDFLKLAYDGIARWIIWQEAHRMTLRRGLLETFCIFDTGHDNSMRLENVPNACPDPEGTQYEHNGFLPLISPDINAIYYGNLMALSRMAELLGKPDEAKSYTRKAETVKQTMFELLYDDKDEFFYDVDRDMQKRRIKTIAISNVFSEHMLSQSEFDKIYDRYFLSPEHFNAPYPLPSIALSDTKGKAHAEKNCWGYFSQALTALRGQLWYDHYGKSKDYDALLQKWVDVYASQMELMFTQELDPYTGKPTDCSRWYSSAMLTYLYAIKRLKLL